MGLRLVRGGEVGGVVATSCRVWVSIYSVTPGLLHSATALNVSC